VTTVAGTSTSKIKGSSLKAAKRRIRGADCAVGKPTKRKGASARTGIVVRQVPARGTTVPVGTTVKVSRGKPMIRR
jgi:beta-lactam-binding protein with PASTA domain